MSHNLEHNNHNILAEADQLAKGPRFDNNSLTQLESLANERANLVHMHRKLDENTEEDVTSVHLYGQRARGLSIGHEYIHRQSISNDN
ncbi:hypothetical protein E3P92_02482 [Wallemia ichthyophaga]|uniref:Uncharacterized protein n=2 Tax=Wallemia ichthyophaga TaxID=245174 RepID=A0A4T0GH67_WALIC|nr:uncharacterized protein J056_000700 [Wallemia ichthyophaga EXF-994]TIA71531.1 hypothetical protein E3P91_02494 [Wallemia ichthyophaga]EOR00502.1 hypothetical protein J056_000700 [Wallemia ichthyophaga EXF-994]TIA82297.1 hypothetical protein E3P98_01465 [Wallemia ichthyophaga]TIA90515.1 hypothetical protein E3P97_02496 [Wallemia ichthyophaga]TIA99021.1 hypothetical protein E3P95_02204 [Wallemia ichthyophaga]